MNRFGHRISGGCASTPRRFQAIAGAVAFFFGGRLAGVGLECFSPLDQLGVNRVTLNQFAYYDQLTAATTALQQGITRPSFYASINSAAILMLKEPTLTIPSTPPRVVALGGVAGRSYSESVETREALEARVPVAGDYGLAFVTTQGSAKATLRFPAKGWPSVPHFANHAELQMADAAGDIVVRWDPFPAAAEADSYLSFQLVGDGSALMFASSTCADGGGIFGDLTRRLPVTATSVVVPKGLLQPGSLYTLQLTFERHLVTAQDVSGIKAQGTGLSIQTTTILKTRGGEPVLPATILDLYLGDGGWTLIFRGTPGHEFVLESAPAVSGPWTEAARFTSGSADGDISFPVTRFGDLVFFRVITR